MCRCILGLILLSLAGSVSAQTGTRARVGELDVLQTIEARKRLRADPHLASNNIGVIVTDRVAVLCGPVASAEIAFRAELCLRTMIEVVEVRNLLYVSEWLNEERKPRVPQEVPAQPVPEEQPPELPNKPAAPKKPEEIFGAPGVLTGQEKSLRRSAAPTAGTAKSSQDEVASTQSTPSLGTPEPDKNAVAPEEPELAAAVRALLRNNKTSQYMQVHLEGRRVYLQRVDENPEHLQEAAQSIARLPNVEVVILVDRLPNR